MRHWDADRQNRARAVVAVPRIDMTALRLDEAAADRQAKAGSGATPILRLDAVELVEDAFEIARRNARAFIDDFDCYEVTVAPRPHIDAGAGRRVFGGVVEEIEQHLLEQNWVEPYDRQIGRDFDLDVVSAQHVGGTPQRRADDVADVEQIEVELDRAGFQPGHIKQIADKTVEPFRFVLQRREQLVAFASVVSIGVAAQTRHRADDRCERRPQIV